MEFGGGAGAAALAAMANAVNVIRRTDAYFILTTCVGGVNRVNITSLRIYHGSDEGKGKGVHGVQAEARVG